MSLICGISVLDNAEWQKSTFGEAHGHSVTSEL
jgi:hypothetical protein